MIIINDVSLMQFFVLGHKNLEVSACAFNFPADGSINGLLAKIVKQPHIFQDSNSGPILFNLCTKDQRLEEETAC